MNNEENCMIDLFKRTEASDVARELNEHLRWSPPTTSGKNNVVSWTNSLLFAIAYAIYRHKYADLKTPLDRIYLCVVDTTMLPDRVFIKDMDLMKEFCDEIPLNNEIEVFIRRRLTRGTWRQYGLPNLIEFRDSRRSKPENSKAYNYFGEYLSQGKLKIEGACSIIPFHKIINANLYTLYPQFKTSIDRDQAEFAKTVMDLRDTYFHHGISTMTTQQEVKAVFAIADNFDSPWRLPIAANLFALRLRREDDQAMLEAFRSHYKDGHGVDYSRLEVTSSADFRLPEVEQFHIVARSVLRDRQIGQVNMLLEQHKKMTEVLANFRNELLALADANSSNEERKNGETRLLYHGTADVNFDAVLECSQELQNIIVAFRSSRG